MNADVTMHGGAVLTFEDVRLGKRTITATLHGRRVELPKDRLLGQKILLASQRSMARRPA